MSLLLSGPMLKPLAIGAPDFNSVTFDGLNDYLSKGTNLTSIADADTFTCVMRLAFAGSRDGVLVQMFRIEDSTNSSIIGVIKNTSNNIQVAARNSSGTVILLHTGTSTVTSSDGMVTLFFNADLSADISEIYVDDTSHTDATPTTLTTSGVIDYDCANFDNTTIMANNVANNKFAGDAQFMWFDTTYYDITQQSVRDKWANTTALGSDGSGPGAQPLVYITGAASVWNAGTNAGSGGNYTMNGSVADA